MRPELVFHTEGFSAGTDLAAVASRRADVLLRKAEGIIRIRVMVIFERLPGGAGCYAARARVDGAWGETAVTEVAHDPDAAVLRAFVRLEQMLGGALATPAAPPPA